MAEEVGAALETLGAAPTVPAVGTRALGLPKMPGMDAGIKRLGELGGERKAAAAKLETDSAGVQKKLADERASFAGVQPPKMEAVQGDYKGVGLTGPQISEGMQSMFALAALGGMMTRQPMTAALNGFTAAMKGLQQADQILYTRGRDEFDRNLKVAMAKNQQAMNDYKLAFERHRGNTQDLMNEWNILTKKHGDTVAAINAERGDIQGMLRHIESMAKMDQTARQSDRMFSLALARMDQSNQRGASVRSEADRKITLAEEKFAFQKSEAMKKEQQKYAKLPAEEQKKLDARNDLLADARQVSELLAHRPQGVGPETLFGDTLMSYYDQDGIPLRSALARMQANYSFGQGGKALTGTEKAVLAPVTEWKGKNSGAIEQQVNALISAIDIGNRDLMARYPTATPGGMPRSASTGAASAPPAGYQVIN